MKITATKDNLVFGVTAVQKAVSTKNTLPILTGIKIEAKENKLYFSATDLEMGIECHIPVDVIYEGATVVPARHFSEIIRKLPDTPITLNLAGENELIIEYDHSQLTLKTLPTEDFPSIPNVIGDLNLEIKAFILKQMIRQTIFAAGTDESRPLFTGILFEIDDGNIRMITTDTHRLALKQGILENTNDHKNSYLIPAKTLGELAKFVSDEEEVCNISFTDNISSFTIGNVRMICRLLEGQFPNYRQVIPTQYKSKILVKSRSIQDAIERISLFTIANDNTKTIQIKIEDQVMTVFSQSEMGKGYEQISLQLEGEPVTISFNSKYLLDVFKVLEAETATLEFTGPLSPCIVRPSESENFLYLLLPVRT